MKTAMLLLLIVLFLVHPCISAEHAQNKNFVISINGKDYPFNPGDSFDFSKQNIQLKTVSLTKNPISVFSDSTLSFKLKSELSVTKTVVDAGIIQLMMASATGTLVMIQEYKTIDPSSLKSMMLNELTKKSIQYGYTKTEKRGKKILASGTSIEGIEAELNYKDSKQHWNVYSLGGKDSGLLIITHIDDSFKKEDQAILDLFWKSLDIKK